MALPQTHAVATAPIAVVSLWLYPLKTSEDVAIFVGVIFFGIFLDADHLSVRRIKRIIDGDWTPLEDYINFLHTWQALVIAAVVSVVVSHYLPLISYLAHLLLDGANEYNQVCKNAPFLTWLHKFYPGCLKYKLGPKDVSPFFGKIAKKMIKFKKGEKG